MMRSRVGPGSQEYSLKRYFVTINFDNKQFVLIQSIKLTLRIHKKNTQSFPKMIFKIIKTSAVKRYFIMDCYFIAFKKLL